MDYPSLSERDKKSWDDPLTTDEIRDRKNDWSLASDNGLLRHFQKFSKDITEKFEKTQLMLAELNNELDEASVMVDNVTNVSLALANTQFIESRVCEENGKNNCVENNEKDNKKLDQECDMILSVSTSILEGLKFMNGKFEKLEVVTSSDEEDDSDFDVYDDFNDNNDAADVDIDVDVDVDVNISTADDSSSDDSSADEADIDDDDDKDDDINDSDKSDNDGNYNYDYDYDGDSNEAPARSVILKTNDLYNNRALPYVIGSLKWKSSKTVGLEPSSSESEMQEDDEVKGDYSDCDREVTFTERISTSSNSSSSNENDDKSDKIDKIYARSQGTLNSMSEIETTTNEIVVNDTIKKEVPSFTEELAKRLANVLPTRKQPDDRRESDDASVNFSKEDDLFEKENVFSSESDDLSTNKNDLFDDKVSSSVWKNKPIKKSNIIPPSLDVPPPINTIETQPKSSIDDLFGDNSDDSDDIFAPKNSWLSTKTSKTSNEIVSSSSKNNDDQFSSVHDENSFPISVDSIKKPVRQVPGILVNQSDLVSSTLGSRLFNRAKNDYSESLKNDESIEKKKDGDNNLLDTNEIVANQSESMFDWNVKLDQVNNENPICSSSENIIQSRRENSTFEINREFLRKSTRLDSEEIDHSERVASDSMLTTHVNKTETKSSMSDISYNQSLTLPEQSNKELSSLLSDKHDDDDDDEENDCFDNDIFSPPPLPLENSNTKSKVSSLFDDLDSGDDLFSNTSSGSRSQKSADQPAVTSHQYTEKSKTIKSRGLFDEPLDLFSNDNSVPEIDIFAIESLNSSKSVLTKLPDKNTSSASVKNLFGKVNLFDDDDEDEDDDYYLFGANTQKQSKIKMDDEEHLADSSKNTDKPKTNESSEKNTTSSEIFNSKNTTNQPVVDKSEENIIIDNSTVSKIKITQISKDSTKLEPPKTLKIRLPNISDTDDSSQNSRRTVSGKIANLMGKMGDLKILSPVDTPPLFKKSEEKPDTDEEISESSSVSLPKSTQPLKKVDIETKNIENSPKSPSTIETETAVSFDVPVQPETLLVRSKSRAKITAKRRPQSRHARQSALRQSGIDFDIVDSVQSSDVTERLSSDKASTIDDKSEVSLEKESSKSITKNTLLSPSTDEEDLFDVPPDLPTDPLREDTLFGRNQILSPFDLNECDDLKKTEVKDTVEKNNQQEKKDTHEFNKNDDNKTDPLRGYSNDMVQDPSQLFARVTKTPSPEKNKNKIFVDDDDDNSLFADAIKKESSDLGNKKNDNLFPDEDSSDLFSSPLTKQFVKKSMKTTRSLFDDDDSDEDSKDDLFGSASSKKSKSSKLKAENSLTNVSHEKIQSIKSDKNKASIDNNDDENDDFFFNANEKTLNIGKKDKLFSSKPSESRNKSIFSDLESDDDDDIFLPK